jgi:hypothetical protein
MEYICEFINKSDNPKPIYSIRGSMVDLVFPNQRKSLIFTTKNSFYARYSLIEWDRKGEVSYQVNPEFEIEGLTVELLNRDGGEIERRFVAGIERVLLRGLPLVVPIGNSDEESKYRKMEIRKIREREPSRIAGYYQQRIVIRDQWS